MRAQAVDDVLGGEVGGRLCGDKITTAPSSNHLMTREGKLRLELSNDLLENRLNSSVPEI